MVAVVASQSPQLRPMRREDLTAVAQIEARAYEFPWTLGIFRDCLNAGYACWVLEQQGRMIGYGVLSVAAEEAHVLNVCVAPAEQCCGHGRRLLRRLVDLARWHGARRVFLEVRPSNVRAVAIYRRAGFVEIGRRPNYYPARRVREDAIVMAFDLLPLAGGNEPPAD